MTLRQEKACSKAFVAYFEKLLEEDNNPAGLEKLTELIEDAFHEGWESCVEGAK